MREASTMTWGYLGLRPAFFPGAALIMGALVGPLGAWPAGPWAVAALGLGACAGWRGARVGGLSALLLGSVCAGAALAVAAAETTAVPLDGQHHVVEGVVRDISAFDEGVGLFVEIDRLDEQPARFALSLSVDGTTNVVRGQRVGVRVKIRARTADDGRLAVLTRRGGGFSARCAAGAVAMLSSPTRFDEAMRWMHGRVHQATAWARLSSATEALVLTLAAGERGRLSSDVEETFSASGLAHVLSVSGLHVAVLAMAVFGLFRAVLLRWPSRRLRRIDPRSITGPVAIPCVWAYVAFTGWQAPAVRSGVMVSLVLLAYPLARRNDALNALAWAAIALVSVMPSAPVDLSVQLSFVAVLALSTLAPAMRAALPLARPDPRRVGGFRLKAWRLAEAALSTVIASVAVSLSTAPLLAETFGRISWVGIISNVFALPLCSALVLTCAAGAAVAAVNTTLGGGCFLVAGCMADLLNWLAHCFAQWPGAVLSIAPPPWWAALLLWFGLAAVTLGHRWVRGVGFGATLLVPLVTFLNQPRVGADEVLVTFLSVGHGDAAIISAGGHHALIDGGGIPHGADIGSRVVLPALRQRRVEALDLVVLTHAHPDHALGLVSVLESIPARHLWLPAGTHGGGLVDDVEDAAAGALVERVGQGQRFALGPATIEVLSPSPALAAGESENDRSVVIRLEHHTVSFLLTGDIEADAEATLGAQSVTVLKAPHHGSRTSSTAAFVNTVRPKMVVFSVGHHNRFGFPHPEVVERYQAVGSEVLRTDLHGNITVHSDGRNVSVTKHAEQRGPSLAARRSRNTP